MVRQLIGQTVGRYRIEALIGEGGMGSVLRGFDEMLQRDVAVKILAPQFLRQPNFRDRFLQEARTAARLRHPGIVQVFDFGILKPKLLPGLIDALRKFRCLNPVWHQHAEHERPLGPGNELCFGDLARPVR